MRQTFGLPVPALSIAAIVVLCLASASCHKDSPHSVTLTWDLPAPPNTSVVGYNIYRRTAPAGQFVKLASRVPKPPYEDRLVLTGREYIYVVTALDQSGRESGFSTEARAKIP